MLQGGQFFAIKGWDEFEYLGVRLKKQVRHMEDIKHTINIGRVKIQTLNVMLWEQKFKCINL